MSDSVFGKELRKTLMIERSGELNHGMILPPLRGWAGLRTPHSYAAQGTESTESPSAGETRSKVPSTSEVEGTAKGRDPWVRSGAAYLTGSAMRAQRPLMLRVLRLGAQQRGSSATGCRVSAHLSPARPPTSWLAQTGHTTGWVPPRPRGRQETGTMMAGCEVATRADVRSCRRPRGTRYRVAVSGSDGDAARCPAGGWPASGNGLGASLRSPGRA